MPKTVVLVIVPDGSGGSDFHGVYKTQTDALCDLYGPAMFNGVPRKQLKEKAAEDGYEFVELNIKEVVKHDH